MNKKSIFSEIIKKENFEVAINKIKKNGKKATGIDNISINEFIKIQNPYQTILNRLENFIPNGVKRVDIPKGDGKTRPLGIPTIEDKIIQMMFKNILEPICEEKFHKHSYGFRPNRKAENAIAWNNILINRSKLHFCVDIDIKGFFDNINHNKLIKQCIAIGITDKKVLGIIKAMLKAPIYYRNGKVEIPNKGTPQGGILSPLLSNICLNELDWWISNQWQTFKTKHTYKPDRNKYVVIKKTNLTEVYLVRYADDFKLLCRDRGSAEKMFKITKLFLKNRLKLEISKIVNLRKQKSEFLGFAIKAVLKRKNGKRVAQTRMNNSAVKRCTIKLGNSIKNISKKQSYGNILLYNSQVRGIQNYYQIATNISKSLSKIGFITDRVMFNRLKGIAKRNNKDKRYRERFSGYKCKTWSIKGITLFTVSAIKCKNPMMFSKKIPKNPTIKQDKLNQVEKLYENISLGEDRANDTEWQLQRIRVYQQVNCICYVTGEYIKFNEFVVHHIIPRQYGGKDNLENLVILKKEIHIELHKKNPSFSNPKFDNLRKEILNCK
jgi:RNA-directed DNA polymerase